MTTQKQKQKIDIFRQQFYASPVAQIITDADGLIRDANRAAGLFFDYPPDVLKAMNIADLIVMARGEQPTIIRGQFTDSDPYMQIERRYRRRDGVIVDTRTTGYTMRGAHGEPLTALIIEDIQEQKQRETLMRVFAHDLKNPLTNIASAAALLREVADGDVESIEILGLMEVSIQRSFELVNQLLALSRLDGGVKLNISRNSLNEFLADVVNDFSVTAAGKSLDLQFIAIEPDLMAAFDPVLMRQAVNNLLSNAIKYTPVGGAVVVSGLVTADEIIIQVRDNGLGIPDDEIEKIFNRFYRVESVEHQAVDGTGLGLSIIKVIVEGHGGRIWAESELGAGSRFYLALPLDV